MEENANIDWSQWKDVVCYWSDGIFISMVAGGVECVDRPKDRKMIESVLVVSPKFVRFGLIGGPKVVSDFSPREALFISFKIKEDDQFVYLDNLSVRDSDSGEVLFSMFTP